MQILLEKYHGLGNDYLVFDPNKNELELNEANVKMICNRNVGLGSDGVGIENSWVVTAEGVEKLTLCKEEIVEL